MAACQWSSSTSKSSRNGLPTQHHRPCSTVLFKLETAAFPANSWHNTTVSVVTVSPCDLLSSWADHA